MNHNNVDIVDKTRMQICRYLLVPHLKVDKLAGYHLFCVIQRRCSHVFVKISMWMMLNSCWLHPLLYHILFEVTRKSMGRVVCCRSPHISTDSGIDDLRICCFVPSVVSSDQYCTFQTELSLLNWLLLKLVFVITEFCSVHRDRANTSSECLLG